MTWASGQPRNRPTGQTAVYRLFNSTEDLLYVGKSVHPPQRWCEHAASKPWWGEVNRKTVEWFESDENASQAEAAAIEAEKPRYNVLGTPRHAEVSGGRRAILDHQRFPQVQAVMAGLLSIEDPAERFEAATKTMELARHTLMPEAAKIRQDAVQELRNQNFSLAEIGKLLGQTRSRVQQISEGRTGGKGRPSAEGTSSVVQEHQDKPDS